MALSSVRYLKGLPCAFGPELESRHLIEEEGFALSGPPAPRKPLPLAKICFARVPVAADKLVQAPDGVHRPRANGPLSQMRSVRLVEVLQCAMKRS